MATLCIFAHLTTETEVGPARHVPCNSQRTDMTRLGSPKRPRRRDNARARGVTRLEAAIVAIGVGLIGGGAALFVGATDAGAETRAAASDATKIREAARSWQSANEGVGCPSISQLKIDDALDRGIRTSDPWGERFRVFCADGNVTVRSAGRDGELGTSDDVRVPRS